MEESGLIRELSPFAEAHAKSCAMQPTEAEDFLQEIMIVLLQIEREYSGRLEKSILLKFARVCARNRIRDLMRHRHLVTVHQVDLEEAENVGDWREERQRMVKNIVDVLIKKLKPKEQLMMWMLRNGYTTEEVGAALPCSRRSLVRVIAKARSLVTAERWTQ